MKRYISYFLLTLMVVTFGMPAAKVAALDEIFYSGNNILFYDPDAQACVSTSIAATGDNVGNTYNFLVSKGLKSQEAAAIVGNLQQESGQKIDPRALNASSGAYGIAQWFDERKDNLLAKPYYQEGAEDKSKELQVQLDFLWEELQGSENASLTALQSATTTDVGELAIIFGEAFERYGEGEEGKRAEYAENIQSQYGNSSKADAADCSVGTGDFVFYEQDDPRWASHPYGAAGTVGPSGCGPTSMAMIVATLANKTVTPIDTATLGAANGSAYEGGTIHLPLISAAAEKWGLNYRDISAESLDSAIQTLKDGGLVYMGGSGPAPFTSGGHIVVMRGVTDDGKIIIGDPYRNAADVYDRSIIEANRGSTFAITKE